LICLVSNRKAAESADRTGFDTDSSFSLDTIFICADAVTDSAIQMYIMIMNLISLIAYNQPFPLADSRTVITKLSVLDPVTDAWV